MSNPLPKPSRRRLRNAALGVAIAVGLYAVVGGLVAPAVLKKVVVDQAREKLGRVVVIDRLSFNPFTLAVRARGFRMMEADGKAPFVSFDQLDIDGSIASIYRLAPVADHLTLAGLKVNLVRDAGTHYNMSDILARLAAAQARSPKDSGKSRFSVSNIRLANARIDFDDRPKGLKHVVSDIDIAIPTISNLPAHVRDYVQPTFAAKVNGTALRFTGETLPFENSLRTHVAIDLDGLDLPRYVEYLPTAFPVRIDSGMLDAHLSVRFTQAADKEPSIDLTGKVALRDFALSSERDGALGKVGRIDADIESLDPLAGLARVTSVRLADASAMKDQWRVPAAEAKGIQVDAAKNRVAIASLATDGGAIELTRKRDGSLELPAMKGDVDDAAKGQAPSPWVATLGKLTLAGYRVTVNDASVKPAAVHHVTIARLDASDLSTEKGARATVTARLALDKSGSVDLESGFALSPLDVDARIDARHVDLVPLRRYVDEFATVGVKSAFASAKGTLTVRGEGDAMRIGYNGAAAVSNLATVETTSKEDLLKWDAVRATGVDLKWSQREPLALSVADIAVDKAYSRMVVSPEGKLNLQQLQLATPGEPVEAAPVPSPADTKPRNVRIDRITFRASRLDFTDHFIKPNYNADVGGLAGTVKNLSSDPASRAVVDLKGSYDGTSPVTIAGTMNPLSGDLFLDIAAKGKDIELPKLSAYSLRYAGYGITKGKLTLDVKYHVEHGKMEGRNRIFLDQLTFGDHVEGPDATKLPVLFAVNLLKNSKGEIDLELPVSGSLDDPQFKVSALVGQIFVNLLKKAVTSPFSLLTAAFGGGGGAGASGGDDLAFVDFEPGLDELDAADRKKLDAVVKALLDRPAIRLEMVATCDAQKDLQALKRAALLRHVKEAKRAALGKAAPPLEQVVLAGGEYARYLKTLYELEAPPKPAPKDGASKADAEKQVPKEVPVAEMEAFLLDRMAVGDDEMRALASRRSEAVRAYLVVPGRLPAERVMVAAVSPEAINAKASRADFTLK